MNHTAPIYRFLCVFIFSAWGLFSPALSISYSLLPPNKQLIGQLKFTVIQHGDTLPRIARLFNVGYYELLEANPTIQHPDKLPVGSTLLIPSRYILPDLPHRGIVVSLAEMRLYYFPANQQKVVTMPIGIGRFNWATPTGSMRIIEKRANPIWYVPKSIKEARAREGLILPPFIPPGPDNPLGHYALRLSKRTYLIHGTNQPDGIGRRTTSGCIRLFPEDIAYLFKQVAKGTHVRITGDAYKAGWFQEQLYLEVHEPLREHTPDNLFAAVTALIKQKLRKHPNARINWEKVYTVVEKKSGVPSVITRTNGLIPENNHEIHSS